MKGGRKETGDMKQQNLKELIATVDEICRVMTDANVGNAAGKPISLKESFHFELLKFAVYLADADGKFEERELSMIAEYLGIKAEAKNLRAMKYRENIDDHFEERIPSVIKYAVLADAARKIVPDPYKQQKAQIMVDTYKLFGQTMLAGYDEDAGMETMSKYTAYIKRLEDFLKEYAVFYTGAEKLIKPVEPVTEPDETEEERAAKLEKLMEEFNGLVGLTEVKHEVNSLVNLIKVQNMRKAQGMKVSDVSKHMVFSGNPGTGKTTVARMLGEIYKYIGVLPKGQLTEVDRGGLVKGYIGQTAAKVLEIVDESLGGILFVDEAYTLTVGKGEGDFGQEAVDTLLKSMEDHRSEFVVIVAGYTDLMEEFLSSNPGLKSRFNKFIHFGDYSADELLAILESMCAKQEYVLSEGAKVRAKEIFTQRVLNKPDNFANARDVRNFLERAIANHASRVVNEEHADKSLLSTLEAEDLEDFTS